MVTGNNERLVYTIDDLVRLGFGSRNTLYRLARLNKLPVPTIYIGEKKMCVSRQAVEALLSGETQRGTENG